jgi:hypothetical protein
VFLNPSVPNVARIYDRLLGGKDNYQADRDAAARLQALLPDAAKAARDNRHFLERVVRYLVGQAGIRQIIDIGTGLPTRDNVHEVAQRIAPETRVVYVDNDRVVVRHGMALLATNANVAMVEADLRAPREIMTDPDTWRLIDFDSPVAVLMLASLHFVTDAENPQAIVRLWRETMRHGSYLAISHITADEVEPTKTKAAQEVYAGASAPCRARWLRWSRSSTASNWCRPGWGTSTPGMPRCLRTRPEPARCSTAAWDGADDSRPTVHLWSPSGTSSADRVEALRLGTRTLSTPLWPPDPLSGAGAARSLARRGPGGRAARPAPFPGRTRATRSRSRGAARWPACCGTGRG